ncbi:hypothetical protein CFL01nite_08200 [Corynebacterium flavescens]|uniref:PTS EIIA type-1 domain-containing protein n=1 Tax=Corynebacterium flavescens TaxID=28028 RepID=A0AB73B606_CORFL|nr:hypothetical protein CFL01nite_08200 [Corynebacterium flavescens]
MLMHIGFDTVNLKGQYFTSAISKNDIICRGQVLAEFDIDGIKKAGYSVTTPVVISNSKKTGRVLPGHDFKAGEEIDFSQELMCVDPRVEEEKPGKDSGTEVDKDIEKEKDPV